MMNEPMPHDLQEHLAAEALISSAREICGFIMKGWVAEPIENVAEGNLEFYMREDQQLHVMIHHGEDIIGIYHSHPGGMDRPSNRDIVFAPKGMRYWIIANGDVKEWVIKDGDAYPVEVDTENVA